MSMQPGSAAVSEPDVGTDRPIVISIRRVVLVMAGIGAALVVAHSVAHVLTNGFDQSKGAAEMVRIFDMNQEASLPTWYSQVLLLAAAVLAFALGHLLRSEGVGDALAGTGSSDVLLWRVIGGALLLASIDEGAGIHERFDAPVRTTIGSGSVAWVIPYALLAVVLVAVLLPFWWRLPRRVRFLTASGAVMYLFGAVLLEAVGDPGSSSGLSARMDAILTLAEETLEMAGASVFIWALAIHLESVLAGRSLPVRVVS